MQYDKDFDQYLKVKTDKEGGVDWESNLKTNKLNKNK